jgi:hypothetical protein
MAVVEMQLVQPDETPDPISLSFNRHQTPTRMQWIASTGDHTKHTVTWRHGQQDLSELQGKAIYLRFQMVDAGIWSFKANGRT